MTFKKASIDRTYLNTIKAINDKPTANIILSGEKLESISTRSRQGWLLSPLLLNIVLEVPSHSNQTRKINKKKLNCEGSKTFII